ncbi:carboxylesterase/lipase family protein [Parahaliea mediterranea]|uniref:Carboxylic ester hydrolase n=1 Tax=Parahaliea mediterranea TaxID=651086 RepID=A0A939IHK5_9GAMM|nr:carboxylesterase family protein [Parahaliea mediterranea]MBN7795584.1 carboxylesterase/lipase family protein [Parahaliea mediterranea]
MATLQVNRRRLLQLGAATALISVTGFRATAQSPLQRLTAQGPVIGVELSDSFAFYGIPFAAPPVGKLRFRGPQEPPPRRGPLRASNFAPAPIQKQPRPGLYMDGPMPLSEDCLHLNIWAPKEAGPHPVYVWIHGGGNVAGASRMPVFDGNRLARHGIVCVSISYRVGVFGFLDVSSILGNEYAGSGNNGLLDIVQALQWVRANITEFGGDPQALTIGGQSAGGKNVCSLLALPAAKGLFRAAICESGGAETAMNTERACKMADDFEAAADGLNLLTASPEALLEAQNRFSARWDRKYPFRAIIDGVHLTDVPLYTMRDGKSADVPVLMGTTRDENAFFGPNTDGSGTVAQGDIANMAIERFNAIYTKYDTTLPNATPTDRRYAALTAEEYWVPTIRAADMLTAAQHKVHVYRLDMPRTEAPNAGYAVHGSELPLLWSKLDDPRSAELGPEGAAAQRLSDLMHADWVRFIKTGTLRDDWPTYGTERATMIYDADARIVNDPDADQRRLWSATAFDFPL